jgi:hypothetical protein
VVSGDGGALLYTADSIIRRILATVLKLNCHRLEQSLFN